MPEAEYETDTISVWRLTPLHLMVPMPYSFEAIFARRAFNSTLDLTARVDRFSDLIFVIYSALLATLKVFRQVFGDAHWDAMVLQVFEEILCYLGDSLEEAMNLIDLRPFTPFCLAFGFTLNEVPFRGLPMYIVDRV